MTLVATSEIPTPTLVIDCEVLDQNIRAAHASVAEVGLRVRPHVKTHKSLEIARRQLTAGAVGLAVATIGEAEVFVAVSDDIFISYPLWPDEDQFNRLEALSRRCRLAIGVDSAEGVEHLADRLPRSIEAMIENRLRTSPKWLYSRRRWRHCQVGVRSKSACQRYFYFSRP